MTEEHVSGTQLMSTSMHRVEKYLGCLKCNIFNRRSLKTYNSTASCICISFLVSVMCPSDVNPNQRDVLIRTIHTFKDIAEKRKFNIPSSLSLNCLKEHR